jgi:hypothetical protein
MDAHEPGRSGAKIGKGVRDAGRAYDDVAGPAVDGFVADPDLDVALVRETLLPGKS